MSKNKFTIPKRKRYKVPPRKRVSLDKIIDFVPMPLTRFSSETEYLMQPYQSEQDLFDWEVINAVTESIEMLGQKEKELIYGLFHDGLTYEELTEVANVKAKSHAWKNAHHAMEHVKLIMEQNPKIKEYLERNK
jgi:hypothetical protein